MLIDLRKGNICVVIDKFEIVLIIVVKSCFDMDKLFYFLMIKDIDINVRDIYKKIVFYYVIELNNIEFIKWSVIIDLFLLKCFFVYDEDGIKDFYLFLLIVLKFIIDRLYIVIELVMFFNEKLL